MSRTEIERFGCCKRPPINCWRNNNHEMWFIDYDHMTLSRGFSCDLFSRLVAYVVQF